MSNELIFLGHIAALLLFTYIALRLGKEALLTLCAVEWVLANLFVTKQITLFSLSVTPTDAYIIASLMGVNLLQEYFGKEAAKKIIPVSFAILLFFTAMSLFQVWYTPSPHDTLHSAFEQVLSRTPRVFIASLIAFFITQRLDIELFGALRKWCSLRYAMMLSLLITQALDTVLFSFLALYGTVSSLTSIVLLSYGIKSLTLISMSLLTPKRYAV